MFSPLNHVSGNCAAVAFLWKVLQPPRCKKEILEETGALLPCVSLGKTCKHKMPDVWSRASCWCCNNSATALCFPGDDWHHRECNCMSHRDLPGLLSERLPWQNAWVTTAHLVVYHKQSTRPCETNGATTVNSRCWLGDRHLGHI